MFPCRNRGQRDDAVMLRSEHRQNLWEAKGHTGAFSPAVDIVACCLAEGEEVATGHFLSGERSVVSSRTLRAP